MKLKTKLLLLAAFVVLALPMVFTGNAGAVVYNPDGAVLNGTTGLWELPNNTGAAAYSGCFNGTATIDASKTTRFDCYNVPNASQTTQSACINSANYTAPSGWLATVAIGRWSSCSKGGYSANSGNPVTDCAANGGTTNVFTRCSKNLANADCTSLAASSGLPIVSGGTATTPTCTLTSTAYPSLTPTICAGYVGTTTTGVPFVGSAGYVVSTGVTTCTFYIGNNATACAAVGGGTITLAGTDETRGYCGAAWIFKAGTVGDWGSSVRNNCLKCHNPNYMASSAADVPVVREAGLVSNYIKASHKNASRKITAGQKLANVYAETEVVGLETVETFLFGVFPSVPAGSAQTDGPNGTATTYNERLIDWVNGKIEDTTANSSFVGLRNLPTGVYTQWYWTDGYYGEDPERGVYQGIANASGRPSALQPACFACHATGYVGLNALDTTKEPERSFPGLSWDGVTTYTPGTRVAKVNLKNNLASRATGAGFNTTGTYTYGEWDQFGVLCSKCHNAANGSHTSGGDGLSGISNGFQINAVCGQCHIRASSSNWTVTAGTTVLTNRANVGTGHPNYHGTDFLNSPHARFSGTYGQVADSTKYNSFFGTSPDVKDEVAENAGGCTGCHDPHGSAREHLLDPAVMPAGAIPEEGIRTACQDCHKGAFAKPLAAINHSTGALTPFDGIADVTTSTSSQPCVVCHMAGGRHLFRITLDTNYTTGSAASLAAKPDGTFTEAVWMDLDTVCGQCHGGGTRGVNDPNHKVSTVNYFIPRDVLAQQAAIIHTPVNVSPSFPGSHNNPVAACTVSPASGVAGTTFTVNATGSSADTINGTAPQQFVNWGDGSGMASGAVASSMTYQYQVNGKYNVTMVVKDALGFNSKFTCGTVAIGNAYIAQTHQPLTIKASPYAGQLTCMLKQGGLTKYQKTGGSGQCVWTSLDGPSSGTYDVYAYPSFPHGVCSTAPAVNTTMTLCNVAGTCTDGISTSVQACANAGGGGVYSWYPATWATSFTATAAVGTAASTVNLTIY